MSEGGGKIKTGKWVKLTTTSQIIKSERKLKRNPYFFILPSFIRTIPSAQEFHLIDPEPGWVGLKPYRLITTGREMLPALKAS